MHDKLAQHLFSSSSVQTTHSLHSHIELWCILHAAEDLWQPQEGDEQAPRSWRPMAPPVTPGSTAAAGVNYLCYTLEPAFYSTLSEHGCPL